MRAFPPDWQEREDAAERLFPHVMLALVAGFWLCGGILYFLGRTA